MTSSIRKKMGRSDAGASIGIKAASAITTLKDSLPKVLAGHGPTTSFSLESFGTSEMSVKTTAIDHAVKNAVNSAFGDDAAWDNLTDVQRDAAIITAHATMSQESIDSYCRAFDNPAMSVNGEANVFGVPQASGAAGAFDYNMAPVSRQLAVEVFDDRNLANMQATSIMYNVLASRQSAAAEAMYPGYALPADGTGFTIEVDRALVFDRIKHNVDGSTIDFNKQRQLLSNAFMDPSILSHRGNEIVPFYVPGNTKNNAFFSAAVAPWNVTVRGESFETAYLKPGQRFSLLGISQHPGIAAMGQNDQTDTLDHRLTLRTVLLEVVAGAQTSIIKYRADNLPFSQFNGAAEGQQRRMVLTFTTRDLPIDGTTLDADGVQATALNFLRTTPAMQGLRLNLSLDITGDVNLESSETKVGQAEAQVDSVVRVTGTGPTATYELITDETLIGQVKAAITSIRFVGYDLEAFRANLNLRDQGKLTTNERLRDAHIVPFSPVFTAQVPVIDGIHNTVDVSVPAQALMIRNTNNAFNQLLTFEEALAQACEAYTKPVPNPAIRAIGRYILRRPWYERKTVDLAAEINSLRSADRIVDVQSAITNAIRPMINRAYYHTNFQAAMDGFGLSTGKRPTVRIVCNPILGNYMITQGDTRSLGEGWTYEVFTDPDMRLVDTTVDDQDNVVTSYRMYIFFSVDGVDGPHPLNFGNFVYLPDLMTNLPITRDQSTTREMSYRSRTIHTNHCPVMMRADITGLESAVAERVAIPVEA